MTNLVAGATMTHPTVQVIANPGVAGGLAVTPEAVTAEQKAIALQDPTVQKLLAVNTMSWDALQGRSGTTTRQNSMVEISVS